MKALFSLLAVLALAPVALARNCEPHLPQAADNTLYYAEVISRSHMDLEMVLVKKNPQHMVNVKVVGGKNVAAESLNCEGEAIKLDQLTYEISRHQTTTGSTSFTATYLICALDRNGKVISQDMICNSEVGD